MIRHCAGQVEIIKSIRQHPVTEEAYFIDQ